MENKEEAPEQLASNVVGVCCCMYHVYCIHFVCIHVRYQARMEVRLEIDEEGPNKLATA